MRCIQWIHIIHFFYQYSRDKLLFEIESQWINDGTCSEKFSRFSYKCFFFFETKKKNRFLFTLFTFADKKSSSSSKENVPFSSKWNEFVKECRRNVAKWEKIQFKWIAMDTTSYFFFHSNMFTVYVLKIDLFIETKLDGRDGSEWMNEYKKKTEENFSEMNFRVL